MDESLHNKTDQIVVFTLDDQTYAFPLSTVMKVIHAIEIRRLPGSPEIITGIINIKGQIIPVADIRKRFGLANRETELNDRIIIINTGSREIAMLVDSVTGIIDLKPIQMTETGEKLFFAENVNGVAKIGDDLVLIYDPDRFLGLEEEKELDHALEMKLK
jgi:purine-binding chemotaxis protein CheW